MKRGIVRKGNPSFIVPPPVCGTLAYFNDSSHSMVS